MGTKKNTKAKSSKAKSTASKGNREILGIVFITIGLLVLLSVMSIFIKSLSIGSLGTITRRISLMFFGISSFIFPFIIMFIGVCFIVNKNGINLSTKFYGIIMFIINTLLILEIGNVKNASVSIGFRDIISDYYYSESIFSGGIIAYFIDKPIYSLLGFVGAIIVFIALYVISAMMIFRISLNDVFDTFLGKSDSKPSKRIKEDHMDEAVIIQDNIGERKENLKENRLNSKIKIIDFMKPNVTNDEVAADKKAVAEEPHIIDSRDRELHKEKIEKEQQEKLSKEVEHEIKMNSTSKEGLKEYKFPSANLLSQNSSMKNVKNDRRELLDYANRLEETLKSFGVNAKVVQVTKGPSVTRFEIQPEVGVKVSKIVNLSDDIALNLAASAIRIEAPIPGKSAVGIEVPNKEVTPVVLREIIESEEFVDSNGSLTVCLGKDIGGNCVVTDLAKMPHVLVAGATGSGKSVCINTLIASLLYKYSPSDVRLLMVDPKVVELNVYNGIPHLLIPVVTDARKAAGALSWAVGEMERRYKTFADTGVKNIGGYNELFKKGVVEEKMPYIVIIIDELADLMMVSPKDVENYIARLAQMARAAGMHLVIATQRPSVDVITGMIKANIPSRIAFAVSSQIDSRTILDSAGAEKLLGKGDMLFYPVGISKPTRIQGSFVSESEIENIVSYIKDSCDKIEYEEDIMDEIDNSSEGGSHSGGSDEADPLLNEAISFIVECEKASTSMLQRKFKIGYNRAARLIDDMEERGIVSGRNGSKPRDVLITREQI